jgi:C-terminal processing protease CtpA/Prc
VAILKQTGAGLVIGAPTAGEARLFENFTLSTGQTLRIGTTPVQVAGNKTISAKGITPDIAVTVNPAAEKILYQDPHRVLTALNASGEAKTNEVAVSTNRARRFNEAELVRRHREGTDVNMEFPEDFGSGPPEHPVITDPVLARALDFLKGIAVLQDHRPL